MKSQNPKYLLVSKLTNIMTDLNLWNDSLKNEIPSSWEKYNNFIVFNVRYFRSKVWYDAGPLVWNEVSKIFNVNNIALKGKIQTDGHRTPTAKVVWGDSKWVEYTDNGISYTWHIENNMFCAGNVTERHRLSKLNCKGETIVDLFSGIGYFTLPLLVYAKCEHVHACEWNLNAVSALRKNLLRNNVSNKCTIHEGDNKEVCPTGIADRVILGLIPTSRKSWDIACRALKPEKGGVLHLHENVTSKLKIESNMLEICEVCMNCIKQLELNSVPVTSNDIQVTFATVVTSAKTEFSIESESSKCLWKKYEWLYWAIHYVHIVSEILLKLHQYPWRITTKYLSHVKSYAPHIDHLVLDLDCRPVRV